MFSKNIWKANNLKTIQIIQALEEWREGKWQGISETDIPTLRHFNQIQDIATDFFQKYILEEKDKWVQFSTCIYDGDLDNDKTLTANGWEVRGVFN